MQANYHIRNYRASDRDACLRLCREHKEFPGCLQQEKNLFIAETGKKVVGFVHINPETGIDRAVLNCLIHSHHRRKGLASQLVACALERVRELGLSRAQVSVDQYNKAARSFLAKLGFKYIRCFWELHVDPKQISFPKITPPALYYRHLQYGEEGSLTCLQNKIFSGSWGFNPNTVEEITCRLHPPAGSPEDVILACLKDVPVGYCWTQTCTEERKGRIHMLGVDPRYRHLHIAKGLLAAGLAYLHSKGLRSVEITVDSHNRPAYHLYRSFGFEVWTASLWYEKIVSTSTCST